MGDNKTDQSSPEVEHDQDESEEQNLLQMKPEIIQLVVLERPENCAVAGAMKGGQGRQVISMTAIFMSLPKGEQGDDSDDKKTDHE